jgi:hypothetical protein
MSLILQCQNIALSSDLSIEGAHQPNSKNDKSKKKDEMFLIWLDALPHLSIGQYSRSASKV